MWRSRLRVILFFLFTFVFADSLCAKNAKIDSLSRLLPIEKGERLVTITLELASEYLSVSPEKAMELGKQGLQMAVSLKMQDKESLAYLTIGSGLSYQGDFKEAKEYIDKGLAIAREINHAQHICTGLNALAAYHMNTGDYSKALSLFNECIDQARIAGLEKQEAMLHFNVGAIYTSMGKWSKGLNEFQVALKYFKKTGDKKYVSRTLMNIAVNYSSWGDFKTSLSYYQASLEYLKQVGDLIGEATVLNNIGEIYKDTGDQDKAIDYYQQSLDVAKALNSKLHEAIPLIGLGEAFWLKKEFKQSEEFSKRALDLFITMQMAEGIARSNYIFGELSLARNRLAEANEFALKSKEIADSSGIQDLQEKVYLLLSKIEEKRGNLTQSFSFYKQYTQVKDSLYNKNHSQQLAQLRSDMELQDKESQIALLQKNNEIKDIFIKRQKYRVFGLIGLVVLLTALIITFYQLNKIKRKANKMLVQKNNTIIGQHRQLEKLNETKDLFLTIIGHDLRNPVGAFKDSLDQLADYPEMFPEDVRQEVICELRQEAANTYFLLDNLLVWAKSQKNNVQIKFEEFSVRDLINANLALHARLAENKFISLIAEVNDNCSAFADPNMVSLILRNLISNAIKFTPQQGRVKVSARKTEGNLIEISVTDNGVGIPDAIKADLFNKHRHTSTFGTNNEKGSGLGLMLCVEFVEMNGGTIEVESTVGKGSTFLFTVPAATTGA